MPDPNQLAQDFVNALASINPPEFERILHPDVGIRIWGCDKVTVHRPRSRVVQHLMQEWSTWSDATLEKLSVIADNERIAVEFRIQATENGRYVEHNRAAFLKIKDEQIESIDLYCPTPFPSARRKGWIAPVGVSDDDVRRLFEAWHHSYDIRESIPFNYSGSGGLNSWIGGTGDAHPGSNSIGGVRWSDVEADAKIEAVIEDHRQRNIGFHWFVTLRAR